MLVRQFVPADIPAVSRVVQRSLGETYPPSLYMTVHNLWPEGFMVLEGEGGVVGFVAAVVAGPRVARVLMLAVEPEHREMSGGSRLMESLYSGCISKGLDTIVLEVRKSNARARSFYERHGFKVTGEIERFYTNGEGADTMSRSLLS
jgi:ribosomal-protein-alanine N-acetyltransferase